LNHVLNDCGQFRSESRVQLLDHLFVAVHSFALRRLPLFDLDKREAVIQSTGTWEAGIRSRL
jgi:hypothetical protein